MCTTCANIEEDICYVQNGLINDSIAGVEEDVYYVQNGLVNAYPLAFNVPINTSVIEIFFTWRSTAPDDLTVRLSDAKILWRTISHCLASRCGGLPANR